MTQQPSDLEYSAAALVGRMMFTISRLELNLGLCLSHWIGGRDPHLVNPLIERLSFKGKLDALKDLVEMRIPGDSQCALEFQKWFKRVDRLRSKRNVMVHGRWVALPRSGQIVNVAPKLPTDKPVRERRYSLSGLTKEAEEAESITNEFHRWRERHRDVVA
jgi:hypothetical protein